VQLIPSYTPLSTLSFAKLLLRFYTVERELASNGAEGMEIIPHLQWTHCKTLLKESKSDPMRTMAWGRHCLHFTEIKTNGMYINCLYYKNDFVPRSYRPKKKRKMHIKSLGEMAF